MPRSREVRLAQWTSITPFISNTNVVCGLNFSRSQHAFECFVRALQQGVKDLLLRARVVVRSSNMKISRCCFPDYVKSLHQKACRTCSTIIFLHSTKQIIDLWRCGWHCCRQTLNALLTKWSGRCVTHDFHGILRSPRKVKHFIYEDSGGIFSRFIFR